MQIFVYHPFALLPVIFKAFDCHIHLYFYDYVSENGLLSNSQFALRKSHFWEHPLIGLTDVFFKLECMDTWKIFFILLVSNCVVRWLILLYLFYVSNIDNILLITHMATFFKCTSIVQQISVKPKAWLCLQILHLLTIVSSLFCCFNVSTAAQFMMEFFDQISHKCLNYWEMFVFDVFISSVAPVLPIDWFCLILFVLHIHICR